MNIHIYLEMETLWNSSKMFPVLFIQFKIKYKYQQSFYKNATLHVHIYGCYSSIVKFSIPIHSKTLIKKMCICISIFVIVNNSWLINQLYWY